jgi:hypothetical protein
MSVSRLAAKLIVRCRNARGEASHTTGWGSPAPNGAGVLSKVGSRGEIAAPVGHERTPLFSYSTLKQ